MTVKIKLLRHTQYGTDRHYPDCDLSRAICKITRKKTISKDDIAVLKILGKCGVAIEVVKTRPNNKS